MFGPQVQLHSVSRAEQFGTGGYLIMNENSIDKSWPALGIGANALRLIRSVKTSGK